MTEICGYGCGREASFTLKTKSGVLKFCCSDRYQKCPAQKVKRGSITRAVHAKRRGDGTVLRKSLLRRQKKLAEETGIGWEISDNHFFNLISGLCYFCGRRGTPYNGLVRFNPLEVFTPQNSIPCCGMCFVMRTGLSPEEFWQRITRIMDRHPKGIVHPSKAVITKSA